MGLLQKGRSWYLRNAGDLNGSSAERSEKQRHWKGGLKRGSTAGTVTGLERELGQWTEALRDSSGNRV